MGAASSKAASQAGPSNVCINLCNTFARTRFAIVPLEAGVHDGWMELLKWSGGTRQGLETVQTRICQFLHAWAAVLYIQGDATLEACMDADPQDPTFKKVCVSVHCAALCTLLACILKSMYHSMHLS